MFIQGVRKNSPVNQAAVNTEGELLTRAITVPDQEHAVTEGDSWSVYTADLNFTTATKQAAVYFKNLEDRDVIITGITIGSSTSAGAADNIILVEQIGNILSTDAIVTGGTAITPTNNNGGTSSNAFTGTVNKGPSTDYASGVAVNGVRGDFTMPMSFDFFSQIPKGGEIGISITPPASNTNMNVTLAFTFFLLEDI